jgi:hypothetical protein
MAALKHNLFGTPLHMLGIQLFGMPLHMLGIQAAKAGQTAVLQWRLRLGAGHMHLPWSRLAVLLYYEWVCNLACGVEISCQRL